MKIAWKINFKYSEMFFQEVLLYVNMYLPNNDNLSERQWLASDVGNKHGRRRDKEGATIGVQSDTEWNDKPTDPLVNAILIFTGLQHFRNGNRSGKCQIEINLIMSLFIKWSASARKTLKLVFWGRYSKTISLSWGKRTESLIFQFSKTFRL